MTDYFEPDDMTWKAVDVRGATMRKSSVWEGEYGVRSAFFRMPEGLCIPAHDHSKWVQVAVIEGRMRVEQDGLAPREIGAGGIYFVTAGERHTETSLVDTLVLVTQGEDRPGVPGGPPGGLPA